MVIITFSPSFLFHKYLSLVRHGATKCHQVPPGVTRCSSSEQVKGKVELLVHVIVCFLLAK